MSKPLQLSYFSLGIVILTLASAFVMAGFLLGILIVVMIGILWGISLWRGWSLGRILSLFFIILGISLAAIMEGSRSLLLVSAVATLTTWDLSTFHNWLTKNENVPDEAGLVRTHLLRLSSVLILGLALPLVAFAMQLELKFWQAFLLGVILLLGLNQVFMQLRRSSK